MLCVLCHRSKDGIFLCGLRDKCGVDGDEVLVGFGCTSLLLSVSILRLFLLSATDPQNAAYRRQFHYCAFDLTMDRTGFTERGEEVEDEIATSPIAYGVASDLVDEIVYDALVWSSLHGLVVGDRRVEVQLLIALFKNQFLFFVFP